MRPKNSRESLILFLLACFSLMLPAIAQAQTDTWNGGTGNWSNGGMWSGGEPGAGSNVAIDGANAAASTVTLDVDTAINSLTVDSDDKLIWGFSHQLTVNGGAISNAGQITINGGNGTNSELTLGASTTLSGGGTITLNSPQTNGGGAAFIQGNGTTLTNTNNVIQGAGVIGNGSMALINQSGGTIDANVSGAGLALNGSGNVTNAGLLEATNSGVLAIQNTVNNSGGNITANGGTVSLIGADIQGGTLNTKNSGTFITSNGNSSTLDGSTHGALTLSAGSTYTNDFSSTTNMFGTINNNGNFQLNGGNGTNTTLNLTGNTTLQGAGGGTVTLNSPQNNGGGAAFIQGNGTTLTNTNNVIQGDGIIGNGTLALINQSGGTINANSAGGAGADTALVLNGGGNVTNAGLMEATNHGVLVIENAVNNTGGNITANGSAATVQLVSADIQGGTLNTLSGGTFITPNGQSSTLDGSTHGALTLSTGSTYTSDFSTSTNILGTINNNGNFQINGGNGTNTTLNLAANTTLQGTGGTVTLSSPQTNGGGAAFIQGNGTTLTNTNNVIQGSGFIGNGTLALVNQIGGTIDANVTGGGLNLNGGGNVTNTGLLEATNGGDLAIENVVSNVGGNITANGGTVSLIGGDIRGGTLNTKNNGTFITPNGQSSTLDGLTNGALTLSTGSTYTSDFSTSTNILGTIINNGNFQINGGNGTNTALNLTANTTLQGAGGTLTLSSPQTNGGGAAYIQGNGTTLTNTNNVIQGSGFIGNGTLALVNQIGGTIDANVTGGGLTLNGGGNVTNTGLLEATNGGDLVFENVVNNMGGNITANGGTVLLQSAHIEGGILNTKNGGVLITPNGNSAILDGKTKGALTISKGSTYTGDLSTTTNILGTITNNGNLQINGGNGTNTSLNLTGNTTLQGAGGTVTLSSPQTNGGGAAFIQGNGFTLTNSTNTIQGAGIIGNGTLSLINGLSGTIYASLSGQGLLINGGGKITNNGTFKVATGASLHVQNGAFTNFTGTTLTGGTYNTAGTLQIDELGSSGGEIVTNAANIILSGTSSVFVDAAGKDALSAFNTNAANGSFTINSGRNFTTAGNFTNNGTLTVGSTNSTFDVNGNLTNFSGTTLTGGTYNVTGTLQFNNANIVTNNANITLTGTSSKITDQAGTTNALLNFATNNGSFTINSGRNFTTTGNFTNNGILAVGSSTSKFDVNGNLTNFSGTTLNTGTYNLTGALQFNNANIVTNDANITLTGAASKITDQTGTANALLNFATNNGSFTINTGRNFTTAGNFTNNGTLTVGTSTSKFDVNGNLSNFSGTTLTGGTYNVTGTFQFNGANIVTNAANIALTGTASKIIDQSGNNGLLNFATNASGGSFGVFGGRTFSTAGAFTNMGTLDIGTKSSFTVGNTGLFTQSSGLTQDDGTLTDSGGLSLSGGTLFGKGIISGNVTNSAGIVTPGDSSTTAGILTDHGTYTQGSSGTLDIFIDGTTAGTKYDQLNVTSAQLNGTLQINMPSGFTPTLGSTFKIINGSESGAFAHCNCAINANEHFQITYQGTDVLLTVVAGSGGGFSPVNMLAVNTMKMPVLLANSRLMRAPGDFQSLKSAMMWDRSARTFNFQPVARETNFTPVARGTSFTAAVTRTSYVSVSPTAEILGTARLNSVSSINSARINQANSTQMSFRAAASRSFMNVGANPARNDFRTFVIGSGFQRGSQLPAFSARSAARVISIAPRESHQPTQILARSFANQRRGALRTHAGAQNRQGRFVMGGATWGLSHLLSKPQFGFTMQ